METLDDTTLVAYVDGELGPEAAARVRAALARDPAAQEKVRLLRESASLTRRLFERPEYQRVAPELAARFAHPGARRATMARRMAWAAAAAVVLAGVFTGGWFVGQRTAEPSFNEELLADIFAYHAVYARENEHRVEVPADRLAHIQTWLGNRLQRTLVVPDLSSRGLTFEGARLLVVDQQPVAQLLYSVPGQPHKPVALCITQGIPGNHDIEIFKREDMYLALWRSKGYSYVLVGWEDPSVLSDLALRLAPELDRS
ncbi:MAG: hypothetical protein ACM30I_06800 [Gemmatimonas sp.]